MNCTIDPTDQADSDSYFENMARAQYRDQIEDEDLIVDQSGTVLVAKSW